MKIRERHGRKGQPQEYYEFSTQLPKFVTQRCGTYWIVGIVYPDGVWDIKPDQYPTAEAGRRAARALWEHYWSLTLH